jgi:hypothetical protein
LSGDPSRSLDSMANANFSPHATPGKILTGKARSQDKVLGFSTLTLLLKLIKLALVFKNLL